MVDNGSVRGHLGENVFHRTHAHVLTVVQLVDNDRGVESKLYKLNSITTTFKYLVVSTYNGSR